MRTLFIPERVTRFTHDALPHPIELEQKPDADVPHEADGTVQADGTCSRLWPTSLVLTRYLCAHPELVAGKRVVELGAGAGCVGLACAALGAEHVVITWLALTLTLTLALTLTITLTLTLTEHVVITWLALTLIP